MIFNRKRMGRLIPAVTATLVLGACGGGSGDDANTLVYGADQPAVNLNPNINAGNSTAVQNIVTNVLPSPYITQPDFTVAHNRDLLREDPATTIQTTPQFVVTYRLNPQARWSDNTPITADDFRRTWEVNDISNPTFYPAPGSPGADSTCTSIATGYDFIQKVDSADDGRTVIVTFERPYADWQGLFSPILPKQLLDGSNPREICEKFNEGWPDALPLSGGPWMVESRDEASGEVVLVPNENYWGTKPRLSRMVHRPLSGRANDIAQAIDNGEVDMIYPQPQLDLVERVSGLDGITTEINFGLQFEHLDFNTANKFLNDVRVRRALALAIDREELVDATVGQFDNRAQVLNNRIFVNNQQGYEDNAGEFAERNVEQAKRLLQQAGFTEGANGVLHRNGEPLKLSLVTVDDNPLREDTGEFISDQLAEVGVDVDLILRPTSEFFGSSSTSGSVASGSFDIALFAWVTGPYLTQNQPIYQCASESDRRQNFVLGCDDRVDAAITRAGETLDQNEVRTMWNQIDRLLWENMFTLPLYQKPTFLAYNEDFRGISDNASNAGPFWNSETWDTTN